MIKFYNKKNKINNAIEQNNEVKKSGIFFSDLLKVYLAMIVGFVFLIPMLYIKSQIYYASRDISGLLNDYAVLHEENRDLQRKIENIKFKNQILDTLDIE